MKPWLSQKAAAFSLLLAHAAAKTNSRVTEILNIAIPLAFEMIGSTYTENSNGLVEIAVIRKERNQHR